MYYDDEGRRFNVLSGLLFGTLLGAGVALLLAPQRGRSAASPARRPAGSGGGGARRRSRRRKRGGMRRKVLRTVAASLAEAWKRSG